MITKEIAKRQAMRLGQMANFPRDNREAIEELVLAIQSADSEDLARAAVSSFLDTAVGDTRCPMPAEIRRWIYAQMQLIENKSLKRAMNCKICNGTGWKIVERANSLYSSGAAACECMAPGPEPPEPTSTPYRGLRVMPFKEAD